MIDPSIKFGYRMSKTRFSYFDSKEVLSETDRATQRVLSRFGAFVRQRAITSMLRHKPPKKFGVHSKVTNREGSAPAGTPPAPHLGLIVKFVQFWYDRIKQSVIIGPQLLNGRVSRGQALAALEYGGESLVLDHGKEKRITVHEHPFMNPSFEAEQEQLPRLWENAFNKK